MARTKEGMPEGQGEGGLLDFLFLLTEQLLILILLLFFLFLRDHVEVDGVDLHHLELDLALRATEDLTFLDFVFVYVNLGCAFGTPNHGRNLLMRGSTAFPAGVLYTALTPESERNSE
jgi:hypothetical protein